MLYCFLQFLNALGMTSAGGEVNRHILLHLRPHVRNHLCLQLVKALFVVPQGVNKVPHDEKRLAVSAVFVCPYFKALEHPCIRVMELPCEYKDIEVVVLRLELLYPVVKGKTCRSVARQVNYVELVQLCLVSLHSGISMHACLKYFLPHNAVY